MRIQPVGKSSLEESFITAMALRMNLNQPIDVEEFSETPTPERNIPVKKIAGVDLSQFNLDLSKEYFVSQETAMNLQKSYL